jgi:SEC-C motif
MRLSEDQIERGLLHADKDVRFACLHYFADCFSRNRTVMPVVIEALEHFGRANAFTYTHPIADLAQTKETIRWVVGELNNRTRRTEPERNYANSLCRLLCHADPALLLSHEKAILGAPGFSHELIKPFTNRLGFSTWAADALWRELETICEEGKDKVYTKDVRYHEAKQIVEALAREGERHAEQMMSLLRMEFGDYENNPMKWMESLMVNLAGELRHEPAIPLLVGKLHQDGEVLSEECHNALVKIGTDSVVQTILHDYPTAKSHFRLYASGVLGHIHTDLALAACIQLLGEERDLELQPFLAQSLVGHFSHEGNEVARSVLLEDSYLFDLKCALVPACTLMGQDFPELEPWRKEIEETMKPKPIPQRPVPQTPPTKIPSAVPPSRLRPVTVDQKAGRNDPCPCGSGKKYKKCCMDK